MPKTRTLANFQGGGPEDGNCCPVPESARVVCFPRLLIERDKTGDLKLNEDEKFTHAYVRMGGYTFAYDGIRAIEGEAPYILTLPRAL